MISEVFAIYDHAARVYLQPFHAANLDVARRNFHVAVNEKDSLLHKHPASFSLFHIGVFDDTNGRYDALTEPQNYGLASSYINKEATSAS
ncbi:MAG: nonstructural protein [Microvirus sp.]|nr:MAG: nonstructural protein [Microvirus sp.]